MTVRSAFNRKMQLLFQAVVLQKPGCTQSLCISIIRVPRLDYTSTISRLYEYRIQVIRVTGSGPFPIGIFPVRIFPMDFFQCDFSQLCIFSSGISPLVLIASMEYFHIEVP